MNQEINFYSVGYKLWARLFIPDDLSPGEKRAAMVECPGFRHGGVDPDKALGRQSSGKITRTLMEDGYVVMVPHCRGMGKSEGRPGYQWPHTRLNPFDEIEDLKNAVTYLQQLPEVDPNKIGVYGYSFGGTLAPYLAAVDHRMKVCVGALGSGDGEQWMRLIRRDWEFKAFKKMVEADLRQQVLTGKPEFIDPMEIALSDPDTASHGRKIYEGVISEIQYTVDSAHYIMRFKPVEVADKIACPLLIIGAENDSMAPVDDYIRVYERAKDPKKLIIIPEMTHYGLYTPENVDKLVDPLVAWVKQWLPAKAP